MTEHDPGFDLTPMQEALNAVTAGFHAARERGDTDMVVSVEVVDQLINAAALGLHAAAGPTPIELELRDLHHRVLALAKGAIALHPTEANRVLEWGTTDRVERPETWGADDDALYKRLFEAAGPATEVGRR